MLPLSSSGPPKMQLSPCFGSHTLHGWRGCAGAVPQHLCRSSREDQSATISGARPKQSLLQAPTAHQWSLVLSLALPPLAVRLVSARLLHAQREAAGRGRARPWVTPCRQ